jgi:hypothetical protein
VRSLNFSYVLFSRFFHTSRNFHQKPEKFRRKKIWLFSANFHVLTLAKYFLL